MKNNKLEYAIITDAKAMPESIKRLYMDPQELVVTDGKRFAGFYEEAIDMDQLIETIDIKGMTIDKLKNEYNFGIYDLKPSELGF